MPLTLRFSIEDQDHSRLGFIIRKKVGKAPMRNSIRRTLRCAFQNLLQNFLQNNSKGYWIVFDVSNQASKCHRKELRSEADRLLNNMVNSK